MSNNPEEMVNLSPKDRLERNPLSAIYSKFRVHYYRDVFSRINNRELSLTTTEVYCVEIIFNLEKPTIQEFANFIGISAPNATYKVKKLVQKRYITKEIRGQVVFLDLSKVFCLSSIYAHEP